MSEPSIPPESLQPTTYLRCSGCAHEIPYAGKRVQVAVKERFSTLRSETFCLDCYFGGQRRIVRNRSHEVAKARCQQMREMRQQGELLKNIGRTFGLDHSTVIHHLQGRCKCQA